MKAPKPRRILAYARVSSTDQALGTSLQDQQDRTRVDAKTVYGLPVTKFFVEAESGIGEKHEKREQMAALMKEAREGDLIYVDKLDRWSRDPEVTYRSIRELKEKGARIRFVSENFEPDTPQGQMMLGMLATFANMEHGRIRERMVGTRHLLLEKGYWIHATTPFGYRRRTEEECGGDRLLRHKLVVVPEEAKIIKLLFREYAGGRASMRQLSIKHGILLPAVHKYLGQKFYAGYLQMPPSSPRAKDGPWVKSDHEPIVDIDLFERVQARKGARAKGGSRPRVVPGNATWVLRDVAVCGYCGARMGSVTSKTGYYICGARAHQGHRIEDSKSREQCTAPLVRVKHIEESWFDEVTGQLAKLGRELAKPPKRTAEAKPTINIAGRRAALKSKRERIQSAFIDGDMTKEERREALAKVEAEASKLDALEIAGTRVSPIHEAKTRRELLGQFEALERAHSRLTPEEAREVVNLLVESVSMKSKHTSKKRFARVAVLPPVFKWRSIEEVHEKIDLLRETLLKGLNRAPTHRELIDQIFA